MKISLSKYRAKGLERIKLLAIHSSIFTSLLAAPAVVTSCSLDETPHEQPSATDVYSTTEGCFSALTKIYASYVISGQSKDGNNDLTSNQGFDFMRGFINLQEAPTEEMACKWLSGENIGGLTYMTWDDNDPWVADTYYRLYYTIALSNSFLENTASRGGDEISLYRAEARFLRALAYSYVLDLFGKGPFVDENTGIGNYVPEAYTGSQLFAYVEKELKEVADILPAPQSTVYGRVSSAAAWALLSRLYLNAEVYGAGQHWTDCIAACEKVEAYGFTLEPDYKKLFNADNHLRTNEIIMPLVIDADNTVTWGATTFIICGGAPEGDASAYGAQTGWGNFRLRGEFVALFTDEGDRRALFTENSGQYFTGTITNEKEGYYGCKFTNFNDQGVAASNTASDGASTDFPLLRLGEVLLTHAEAIIRSGGDQTVAKALLQQVRDRAYGKSLPADDGEEVTVPTVRDDELTLDYILAERGRELWWECQRRTDLVRCGKFTTASRLWQWKGGTLSGRAVDATRNTYPIPAAEKEANPNLK